MPPFLMIDAHHPGPLAVVVRELVGVPAVLVIATVGIDRTEHAINAANFELVREFVAGQGGVVGFDVHFELVLQAVLTQEAHHGGGVVVVLMLGWLAWFRLDQELTVKPILLGVVTGHAQEGGEVIAFAFHVGVEQAHVAFAAAPEDVVFAVEVLGDVEHLFDRVGAVRKHIGVGAGAGTLIEAWMAEQIRGAPQQFDAGGILQLFEFFGNLPTGFYCFLGHAGAFWGDVAVMEAVVGNAQLLHEVKHRLRRA